MVDLILAGKKVIFYDLMIETSNKREGDDLLTQALYLNLPACRDALNNYQVYKAAFDHQNTYRIIISRRRPNKPSPF